MSLYFMNLNSTACEREPVTEGITNRHIPATPGHILYSRAGILVLLRQKLRLKLLEFSRLDSYRRPGSAVAVVLR